LHIMEGFLPLEWCIFWYLLSIPVLIYGLFKVRTLFKEHPEKKIMVALSGAFMFVLSSLKLPSVTGSSSHPTGTGMGTMLFGVGVTSVLTVIVLIFQAILIAHGGITTLGANLFSMGIVGPFVAYIIYMGLRKVNASIFVCGFVVGFVADLVTYAVTATQLALAFPSAGGFFPSFETFMMVYAVTQVPLAIVEGILTGLFLKYLAESRPDLLGEGFRLKKSKYSKKARNAVALAFCGIVTIAFVLTRIAGLEGSDDQGSNVINNIAPNYVPWWNDILTLTLEQEIILFAIQSFIGLTIIVYAVKYYKSNKQKRSEEEKSIVNH
jgi:cobalt/nickel transport system permease protein